MSPRKKKPKPDLVTVTDVRCKVCGEIAMDGVDIWNGFILRHWKNCRTKEEKIKHMFVWTVKEEYKDTIRGRIQK